MSNQLPASNDPASNDPASNDPASNDPASNDPAAHATDHANYMFSEHIIMEYQKYFDDSNTQLGTGTDAEGTTALGYTYDNGLFDGSNIVIPQHHDPSFNMDGDIGQSFQEYIDSLMSLSPGLSTHRSRQSTPDSGYSSPTPTPPPPSPSPRRRRARHEASSAAFLRTPGTPARYECFLCNRTYSRVQDVRRHYSSHFDERKELCSFCPKAFKRRDTLKRHVRNCRENPNR